MKDRVFRFALGAVIVGVILAPAAIWSGKRMMDFATQDVTAKLPETSTVGPEMTPYVLTPSEREKLKLPALSSPIPLDYLRYATPRVVRGSQGPYPGMTQAELEKLAAWEARMREGTPGCEANAVSHEIKPVSTVEIVPRAPGIEGMTPVERAKLEAYAKEGGQK